ncbi:MAG: tyrosine-type recombinase/integrase [Nevskia sp.]
MPLTDKAIRAAKPKAKSYKLSDERGLYLAIQPNGGLWWRLKYRVMGKEKLLALGTYPDTGLADARIKRESARSLLAQGVDPGEHRKLERARGTLAAADSFEALALEWLAKFGPTWTEGHGDKIKRRLERDVFPWIGTRPVGEIMAPELLAVLRRIEGRGAVETAHRAHQNCGQVFRYAVATGRAERDPSADLRGALPPVKQTHHASITDPKSIGELLRALQSYKGSFVTQCALRLAPLTFVRPGELRHAEWNEFDFDAAEWRIPAGKMKAGALHIIPLSHQAVAILRELQPLTGSDGYLFPSVRTRLRPMSDNTILGALRRLGYSGDQMTGHGFRSMASTLLNEHGWHKDAIERQLAHGERNKVRAAYNYAEHLPERRKMMQAWADYLDSLAAGGKVVPIGKRAA